MSCSRTCGGQCCAVFTLQTPLAQHYGEQVQGMAIPLTDQEAAERRERFGGGAVPSTEESEWKYFTCSNWDEESRLCTIYDDRPVMCRDYPYEKACSNQDCTYEADEATQAKWRAFRERQRAREAANA